jgi:hypothetical protein
MLNLLKNNLFDYYARNATCTGCLYDNCIYSLKEYDKFTRETGAVCSGCFYCFLQTLKERSNKSYKKLLNYMLENNNICYIFPCNNDNVSEKMKQIILNSIIIELDIE